MSQLRFKSESEGIMALVRETVDGIGRLISEHLKLARLEFHADMKVYGRTVAVLLLVAAVFALAYGLACIGLSVLLSRWVPLAYAFFLVAGAHILIGGVAAMVAVGKLRGSQAPMRETVSEVQRSVGALTSAGSENGAARAMPDSQLEPQFPEGGASWPTIRT